MNVSAKRAIKKVPQVISLGNLFNNYIISEVNSSGF